VHLAGVDLDAAEAQLRDVLRRFPDSRTATLNLVRVLGLRGDEAGAQKLLEDLLARHPSDEAALAVLLPSLLATKQNDRAIAVAEAAHLAAPDSAGITAALARAYARAKQYVRAEALLDRASAGIRPQLDVLRGQILQSDGKTDEAEAAFRSALQSAPGNTRASLDLTTLLVTSKRYDDAREVLNEALKQTPGSGPVLGALVGIDLKEKGIKAALATVETLKADPQNQPAINALAGDSWLAVNDFNQAATAFEAALKAAPSTLLVTRAAGALSSAGHNDKAIALLTSWLASHPDDLQARAQLSSIDLATGDLATAATNLEAILAQKHADTGTLNNLAWVKQQEGDLPTARNLAQRAYFQSPLPQVADTLGWIMAQMGDTAKAEVLLKDASLHQGGSAQASAQYHYAWVLNAEGKKDQAREAASQAAAFKGDFKEKADARKLLDTLK
jgi:tetratricopeptide (TPR) repeat protein